MRLFIFNALFCLLAGTLAAQSLSVFDSHCVFYSEENGTYVESYVLIPGNTVTFAKQDDGTFAGAAEITLIYKKGEDITAYDKYILESPSRTDTSEIDFNLVDVRRFPLSRGLYTVSGEIVDANNSSNKTSFNTQVNVDHNSAGVAISGIQLIDEVREGEDHPTFAKNGYTLVPYVLNYLPSAVDVMQFYLEVYNVAEMVSDENFLLTYSIEDMKGIRLADFGGFKKRTAKSTNVLLASIDVSNLLSGNYFLIVEARDKSNNLLAEKRLFFQRNNKMELSYLLTDTTGIVTRTFVNDFDFETLRDNLECLIPIAGINEYHMISGLIKSDDTLSMRNYFYHFWTDRNYLDPEGEWLLYKEQVDFVDEQYATSIQRGFETDRGSIYLEYGPPNDAVAQNEPGSYAYEIWKYNATDNGQSNVKFVFYNSTMVWNDYVLLHSTAIGELNDPQWLMKIYDPVKKGSAIDPNNTELLDYDPTRRAGQLFEDL